MSRGTPLTLSVLTLLALVYGSVGCGGGGGGGGGGPTEPPPPSGNVTFTPDSAAGQNSIHLAQGAATGSDRLVIDVKASQVSDLYGVSFHLEFPSDLLAWLSSGTREGSFLSASGSTDLIVEETSPGLLVVGHSLLGDVEGSDGSGTLFSLEFEAVSPGSGPMDLTDRDAVNSFGDIKTQVTWIDGSVTVRG